MAFEARFRLRMLGRMARGAGPEPGPETAPMPESFFVYRCCCPPFLTPTPAPTATSASSPLALPLRMSDADRGRGGLACWTREHPHLQLQLQLQTGLRMRAMGPETARHCTRTSFHPELSPSIGLCSGRFEGLRKWLVAARVPPLEWSPFPSRQLSAHWLKPGALIRFRFPPVPARRQRLGLLRSLCVGVLARDRACWIVIAGVIQSGPDLTRCPCGRSPALIKHFGYD